MKVSEASKLITKIDKEIKNLQKFNSLSEQEKDTLERALGVNSTLEDIVCTSINAMSSYKNIIKQRIDDAEINDN